MKKTYKRKQRFQRTCYNRFKMFQELFSVKNNNFDEFLEEVEKDIQQEKWHKIWNKYGKFFSYLAGGFFACAAFGLMWKNYEAQKKNEIALEFSTAQHLLETGKKKEALNLLESISASSHRGYAGLSLLMRASYFFQQNDRSKALALYKEASVRENFPSSLRDLAILMTALIVLDEKFSQPLYQKALKDLEPLTHKDHAWHPLALEFSGLLLHRLNQLDKASDHFVKAAQDPKSPDGVRMRCQLLSQMVAREILGKS